MNGLKQSVLKTVVYADCFDYALSAAQINQYLIGEHPYPLNQQQRVLNELVTANALSKFEDLYCLSGREKLLLKRRTSASVSATKIEIARKQIKIMTLIPWIDGIWITGNVAVNNARDNDDIDLLVVTKDSYVWLTRLLLLLVFGAIGRLRLRRHAQKSVKNKLCLNMYLDATALVMPQNKQNLYTAHEVAQVMPLFNRHKAYEHFMAANAWILEYLPHTQTTELGKNAPRLSSVASKPARMINRWLYKLQHYYMRNHLSREVIDEHRAFFHPRDTSKLVMEKYTKRCSAYALPK
jgi:hypothetical protein